MSEGAAIGAVSALAFHGIGSAFAGSSTSLDSVAGAVNYATKAVAHGIVGGTMTLAYGGDFAQGFLSTAVTQAFSGPIGNIQPDAEYFGVMARTAVAAALGGTISQVSGGSFANGAITGAFSRLFNDEMHPDNKLSVNQERELAIKKMRILLKQQNEILNDMTSMEGTIVMGEAVSTGHVVLSEGVAVGAVASKGYSVGKGALNITKGAYRSGHPSVLIDKQLNTQQLRAVAAGVGTETLSAGAGYVTFEAASSVSSSFMDASGSGRGSLSMAYSTASSLERSYFRVTKQLNQLRSEYRQKYGN